MVVEKMNSLVDYPSSEDSEEETPVKLNLDDCKRSQQSKKPLPLPDDIKQLFTENMKPVDDPLKHDGRIRSFEHVEGNWATLIYIPYEPEDEFAHLQEQLLLCLRPLEFHPLPERHLSLSRTVAVRHHWIQEIKQHMAAQFAHMPQCGCEITGVRIYTNDEKTRSFLALEVTTGDNSLERYVKVVDKCFEEYKLETYYQPPSFHVSVAWCLGDVQDHITQKIKCKLKDILDAALEEDAELRYFTVEEVKMKTGNKEFIFPLR